MWLCGWLCGWLFDFACLCVWLRRRSIPDVNFWFLPKSQWMTSEIFTAVRSHLSCSNQHTHIQHRAYTYSPWCGNFLFSFLVAISLSLSLYVFPTCSLGHSVIYCRCSTRHSLTHHSRIPPRILIPGTCITLLTHIQTRKKNMCHHHSSHSLNQMISDVTIQHRQTKNTEHTHKIQVESN